MRTRFYLLKGFAGARLIVLWLCLGPTVITSGCYNPSIADGGLTCGTGSSCPQGFSCSFDSRCHRNPSDGGRPEVRAEGGADRQAVDGPDGGEAGRAPQTQLLGETCNQINAGTANRTDNCVAGLVCIDGNMGSTCFQKCTGATDCGETGCERRRIESLGAAMEMVCGLGPTTCSPVPPQSGCPVERTCYLRGAVTICETSSGERLAQEACSFSRECLPGYTCASGVGAGYCRRVCSDTVPCSSGGCLRAAGATYGYCL